MKLPARGTQAIIAALALTLTPFQAAAHRPNSDDLTPCALALSAASFDGTIVKVCGAIETGFEQSVIRDAECPTLRLWVDWPDGDAGPSVSTTFGSDRYAQSREWTEFASVSSASDTERYLKGEDLAVAWQPWRKRAELVPKRNRNLTMLESLLKQTCTCPPGSGRMDFRRYDIVATVTGRFEHVPGPVILRNPAGGRGALLGYGHMSGYENRLVLGSVVNLNYRERGCR
ncbi:MAG TPA: hypothetical protein VGS03_07050 [Candidatus Polarisedimenticolia bacterium]|jgi:hypothetical protein|nr:hypothetical protein [Candidatus Polarisedimenticolia bacterium]